MATWSKTIVVPRKNVSVSFVPYNSSSSYSWMDAERSLQGSAFACRFDAGDGKYSKISVNFSSKYYVQEVIAYLYDSYANLPRTEADIPTSSYVGMARITDIPGPSGEITISFENVNKKFYPYAYVILKPTSNSQKEFSFYDVAVETVLDDTPPICYFNTPDSPGEDFPNYDYIPLYIKAVWPESGMRPNQYEVQCSYEENNWENPILTKQTDSFFIQPNTLEAGTVYCRGRAKTSYSEWGSWSYTNFTAVERKAYINNIGFKQGFLRYQDRTKPIAVTWFQVTEGITVTHSVVQYALKENYNNWINLGTVEGDIREFTIPANTFPAVAAEGSGAPYGGIKLKIISYNSNEIASEGNDTTWFLTVDSDITVTSTYPRNGASLKETEPTTVTFYTYTPATYTLPIDVDLRWRVADGEWQYLNHLAEAMTPGAGGSASVQNTVTIPANTFPGAVIYYQVRAYNQDGVAGDWSSEAYFTTIDKPQIATPIQPINTIEDADKPILFVWSTSSQSGEASRGAELQYSTNQTTWVTFARKGEAFELSVGDSETFGADEIEPEEIAVTDLIQITEIEDNPNRDQYTAPSRTFPPGVIFWRVRSYNRNLSPGEWSAAVSFVAKAAPTVQDIQATAKPWATVIWQADDQQTYEIFVDGESIGSYFGTEKQFPLPDYLEDGVHTVGVRVMGSFSLWSRIAETQVTIANTQVTALTLTAETNIDTALSWEGGNGDFFVYRDGLMIAHTNEHSFTDRVTLGTHEYRVIERLASGDYNASETLTRTPAVPYQYIAALAGGDWIGIPYTLKSQADPSYQESQEVAFNYLSGNDYPTASIGSHRTDVGQYSAVFLYTEEASNRAFLALCGKPVILKTADGEVMIGVLNAWERRPKSTQEKKLYTAYTFTLQRIGWEDFIDDTA